MGDHNRAKGKEGYPSLAFQCITDYNQRVLSVYGPQFGTLNDKDIVKHDVYVQEIRTKWLFKDTGWQYYAKDGRVWHERGVYLICNNGYLPWPTSICPFAQASKASL
jgi:hypothetical protein